MLMQNDMVPGWANKPKPDEKTEVEDTANAPESLETNPSSNPAPTAEETSTIDEAKIEEEFGPPPDTVPGDEPMKQPAIHKRFWSWAVNLDKKRKLFYGALVGLLLAGGVVSYIMLHQPAPPVVPTKLVYRPPAPNTEPSKLTGLQVDPKINDLQVTGVMIENSVYARPQSSLSQAGVVYEAIAEAGITRFMALFQDSQSDYIGPVRSARPYFVQWCQAFDCALAHVGGSPEALKNIKDWHVKNLDQFVGAQYFHRINSRYAPHNMYTSQAKLSQYEKSRGYTSSDFTGFEHLEKEPKLKAADITTTSVNINYPGSAYDVHYSYDAKNNQYLRSEGGEAHYSVDAAGKKTRNAPKVVIALVMAYSHTSDGYHSAYNSTGSGSMYVFQNGTAMKGTWSREARDKNFVFKDSNGKDIQLTPGQTWISAASQNADVTYN